MLGLRGFEALPARRGRPPIGAEYETGNLTLGLLDRPRRSAASSSRARIRSRSASRTSKQARAKLEQSGVQFVADNIDSGVCHMAFFEDPHGNTLMLHHRYAPED